MQQSFIEASRDASQLGKRTRKRFDSRIFEIVAIQAQDPEAVVLIHHQLETSKKSVSIMHQTADRCANPTLEQQSTTMGKRVQPLALAEPCYCSNRHELSSSHVS
jgi:hypothetical protein